MNARGVRKWLAKNAPEFQLVRSDWLGDVTEERVKALDQIARIYGPAGHRAIGLVSTESAFADLDPSLLADFYIAVLAELDEPGDVPADVIAFEPDEETIASEPFE